MVTANILGTGLDVQDILLNRDPGVALNDAVYIGSSNTVFKATAASPTPQEAFGFVVSLPSPTTAMVRVEKTLATFGGLTPAAPVFLSTTAGAVTQTAPSASGEMIQQLGIAITATTILIQIDTEPTVNA